jgi:hypothetical protein
MNVMTILVHSRSHAGVPIHHSLPGAAHTIYINFLGATITGTAWNTGSGASSSYQAVAYSLDADKTTFTAAEQASMSRIWNRVAEDYAPFNVDVTTERPATFTPTTGTILVTNSKDATGRNMPYSTAGGVAYMNVFGDSNYVS